MTPQQQADYDYAMSQIKPKCMIEFASISNVFITANAGAFSKAIKAATESMKSFEEQMVKRMRFGIIPNCKCTIKNDWEEKGSTTDAKDPKSE